MEEIIQQLAASGPLGVIAAGIVYLVIYFQRKQTSEMMIRHNYKIK